MPYNTKTQPHFIDGMNYPLIEGASRTPPIPCEFAVGDSVTFINDYGVEFPHQTVTGFSPTPEYGRFVYFDSASWWFAAKPEQLVTTTETEKIRYSNLRGLLDARRGELAKRCSQNPDDLQAYRERNDIDDALTSRNTALMEAVAIEFGLFPTREVSSAGSDELRNRLSEIIAGDDDYGQGFKDALEAFWAALAPNVEREKLDAALASVLDSKATNIDNERPRAERPGS